MTPTDCQATALKQYVLALAVAEDSKFQVDQLTWVYIPDRLRPYEAKVIARKYMDVSNAPGWYYKLSYGEQWIHEDLLFANQRDLIAAVSAGLSVQ